MAIKLTIGGNASIPAARSIMVRVSCVNTFACCLTSQGKISHPDHIVSAQRKHLLNRSVELTIKGKEAIFSVYPDALYQDIQKISFIIFNEQAVTQNRQAVVEVNNQPHIIAKLDVDDCKEKAIILGELYLRHNEWKFRFVAQGFRNGLRPLASHFDVDVSAFDLSKPTAMAFESVDSIQTPTAQLDGLQTLTSSFDHATSSASSHSQESLLAPSSSGRHILTQKRPSIQLKRQAHAGASPIRAHLHWYDYQPKRLLTLFNYQIKLELGAFVRFKNRGRVLVQGLGNYFGHSHRFPFVELGYVNEDGERAEGEWITINSAKWDDIEEITLFTYQSQGFPNWLRADARLTIEVPGQSPVEVALINGNDRYQVCAIALLSNVRGALAIRQLNQYFRGHRQMDQAYRWGLCWRVGHT